MTNLNPTNLLNEASLDLSLFRLQRLEAVRAGFLSDDEVWRRWLV